MSKLDNILADYYGEGDTSLQPEAKQQIKDLMLEIVEECDPAKENRNPDSIYWGNVLRKKVEEL